MGLDISFIRRKKIVCPKCGEIVCQTDVDCVDAGGRGWYPILESIGYYVPREQLTEENDWCGKDMVLTEEQADEIFRFAVDNDIWGSYLVQKLIAEALYENNSVVVNADW